MKKSLVTVLALTMLLGGCGASEPSKTDALPVQTETAQNQFDETVPSETENETVPQIQEEVPEEAPTVSPEEKPAEEENPAAVSGQPTEPQPTQPKPTQQPQSQPTNPTEPKPSTGSTAEEWYLFWKLDASVIRFHKKEVTIPLKGGVQVTYTYHGNKQLEWRCDASGLSISPEGYITAVKTGTYTVSINDDMYAAVMTVIVPEPSETATGKIYFEQSAITLQEGDSMLVGVKGDITGGYVTYTSSNPKIVTMSGEFLLAVNPGTAVITASHGGRTATMTVTVTRHPDTIYLDLSPVKLTLKVGEAFGDFQWGYNGSGKLRWTSSDESVAIVDAYGTVLAVGEGTCKIYLADAMRAESCVVTVIPNPDVPYATEIKTGNFSQPLQDGCIKYVGDQMTFDAWAVPLKAKRGISVSSSDRDVVAYWTEWATADGEKDRIHLIFSAPGKAKITLRTVDGKASLSFWITVEEPQ